MQVDDVLAQARDSITVKRVFGDPIERDGMTVIPVANVMGGAGGGSGIQGGLQGSGIQGEGSDPSASSGTGAGYGVRATPAGVYVVRGDTVKWEPAVDMGRVILVGQLVAIVALLVLRSVLKRG
jgi:uncharacterized spore protein YtfJ